MIEWPEPDKAATLALVLGALFLLRLTLLRRRLLHGMSDITAIVPGKLLQKNGFGQEFEPERRMAVRQLILAALFFMAAAAIFLWMAVNGLPIRLSL